MKLLMADDHTLFRDSLVQYITRAMPEAEVTTTEDFHQAYKTVENNTNWDLVLLDLRMPGMNGMEGFEKMRKKYPEIPLALMSGVAEPADVKFALDLGAVGYFPKTLSGKALLEGIQDVLDGDIFIPTNDKDDQPIASYHADENQSGNAQSNDVKTQSRLVSEIYGLTPREKDVLEFLLTGTPNKDIADALDLQVVTVKLHVRGICRKLDANNRTQAALIAKEARADTRQNINQNT